LWILDLNDDGDEDDDNNGTCMWKREGGEKERILRDEEDQSTLDTHTHTHTS
jgi:hypothetical protein